MARPKPGEIVGMVEIARMLKVEKATAWRWNGRGLLPEPFDTVSRVPLWMRADIEGWAVATGRMLPEDVTAARREEPAPVG